ncbi:MAG: SMP-30/gluconolactonase/LRE family protein [Gammaproteobacteria bacterium]|nr:SMP-30/gluconolactonase/LRE family protein [Gammaproteobacteria bacterium]
MKQIKNSLLILIATLLPGILFAASPILVPAWQTEAHFEQAESVVYDATNQLLYVSNINGDGMEADYDGYISSLSLDGQIVDLHWLEGLHAPKGLTIVGNFLYVADINELVVIDIRSKKVTQRYSAPNAKFLNDVAADDKGNIYVSAFLTNTLYRLKEGIFDVWIESEELEVPNGLLVEGNQLILASWGHMTDGFATDITGHLKTINLDTKEIKSLGDKTPIGNLDGIEPDGEGNYFVTDWMTGELLHITPSGISSILVSLERGSADHTVLLDQNLVIIPMMLTGNIVAFEIKK